MIYGANGYTGQLVVRLAAERGWRPIVAGRNAAAIGALAARYNVPYCVLGLEDASALDSALHDVSVVLHCAGPFAHTSRPMAEACLRTRTHYLDITGEVAVFEALALRDMQARAAGIMLLPGAGFDVVPSDCLALYLKQQLPGAQRLTLAFQATGGVSWGTATTAVEHLGSPTMVRRGGKLVPLAGAPPTRRIDFGRGPVATTAIAWGDLVTAYWSTGIPHIEVYAALGGAAQGVMMLTQPLRSLLAGRVAQALLKRLIRTQPPGPSDATRAQGQSLLWGEAEDATGKRHCARLRTPEAYTLTAHTALALAERAMNGGAVPGFQTPAQAYGADFILDFPGVTRKDIPCPPSSH